MSFTQQMLLPLGGLFIAVFAGWFVLPQLAQQVNLVNHRGWVLADTDSLAVPLAIAC